jgi:prepilin-type N-terminal cleavage/methylation domain-containing protein
MRQPSKRGRRGFTLLELVIVLIIIATVAGLVIPQLGFLGRTADMAASAKGQQDVANQLGLYFVLQKRFPGRMDSLLDATASVGTHSIMVARDILGNTGTSQANQRWGFPLAGANGVVLGPANLEVLNLGSNSDGRRSFTRAGFDTVVDHTSAVSGGVITNANDSGQLERSLSPASIPVAAVTAGSPLAQALYPASLGVFPDDVACVVAVGVGPRCTLVPNTMLNAPSYPASDGSYYGRFVAYFACFRNGERAQLIGVSDSYGRFPNYTQGQFAESLPNNGRQG